MPIHRAGVTRQPAPVLFLLLRQRGRPRRGLGFNAAAAQNGEHLPMPAARVTAQQGQLAGREQDGRRAECSRSWPVAECSSSWPSPAVSCAGGALGTGCLRLHLRPLRLPRLHFKPALERLHLLFSGFELRETRRGLEQLVACGRMQQFVSLPSR